MALVLYLALASVVVIGLRQSVRSRTCRTDQRPRIENIIVWLIGGIVLTAILDPTPWLALPTLALALLSLSLIIGGLTRLAWRLGL